MPYYNTCGQAFQWGYCDNQWVLLEPIGSHDDLDKSYMDADGTPRADHRDRHDALGPAITVTRLQRRIKAEVEIADDPIDPVSTEQEDGMDMEPSFLAKVRKTMLG